jgi:hypothetical protein
MLDGLRAFVSHIEQTGSERRVYSDFLSGMSSLPIVLEGEQGGLAHWQELWHNAQAYGGGLLRGNCVSEVGDALVNSSEPVPTRSIRDKKGIYRSTSVIRQLNDKPPCIDFGLLAWHSVVTECREYGRPCKD